MRIPEPRPAAKKYPHEFSGGQQQRIAIAMAIAARPQLLLLDEPTSGLDPENIRKLLTLLNDIRQMNRTSMVMVSHDLDAIRTIADRVAILNKGKLEICDTVANVFSNNNQAPPNSLIQAFRPEATVCSPGKPEPVVIECHNIGLRYRKREYFPVFPGNRNTQQHQYDYPTRETVVITGQSGSGKSSLLNCIAGLATVSSGNMLFNQSPLEKLSKRPLSIRKDIQLIFQNSDLALNPAMTIQQILQAPLRLYFQLSRQEINKRVSALLEKVHLSDSYLSLKPAQLSGGERQRIAIARACAAEPALLLCDEVTAALDVINRNGILALLKELTSRENCACLMVTHEQDIIRQIADRVYVMSKGEIIHHASREEYLLVNRGFSNQTAKDDHSLSETLGCIVI